MIQVEKSELDANKNQLADIRAHVTELAALSAQLESMGDADSSGSVDEAARWLTSAQACPAHRASMRC
jgi:hypothetical protein